MTGTRGKDGTLTVVDAKRRRVHRVSAGVDRGKQLQRRRQAPKLALLANQVLQPALNGRAARKRRTLAGVSSAGSAVTATACTVARSSADSRSTVRAITEARTGHASVHCESSSVSNTTRSRSWALDMRPLS